MSPDPTPPGRRGRPPSGSSRLSRGAIVQATLDVVRTEGLDGVSMRAVARVLGVDAKSLYNHVDGKDGLLDAIAEHLLASIVLPAPTGDLRVDVRAIADAFRKAALAHPAASAVVLTRQLGSFEALAPIQALLQVLRSAGHDVETSVHLFRMLVATIIGVLLREVQAGPAFGMTDIESIAAREEILRGSGLDAVSEAAPHLARFDATAEYEFTIALATDAILAR